MAASDSPTKSAARPERVTPVLLSVLAAQLDLSQRRLAGESVTGVSLASSTVRPGDLYAALPGARTHGAKFARAAAEAGASAILTDAAGAELAAETDLPLLLTESPRRVLGRLAALVYGDPAQSFTLIGVTGTQGKTTTTQLINAAVAASGRRTAVIGTMGTWIDGRPVGSSLTTPEAPDLHALFAVMRERQVDVCAMEVSSHALVMGRVDGVVFDLAVFTNFGRDHLDFHASVEDYFAAKADLFTAARCRRALINADDSFGARLVESPQVPTRTFATSDRPADWKGRVTRHDRAGSAFEVTGPEGERVSASVCLAGAFNVANAVCAIAAVAETGGDLAAAARGIAALEAVEGRMQPVDAGQQFTVIVDYAHKPDAVTAALEALRPVTAGRLIIVIGAGGDRDPGKRPLMGEIAARLADVVIVTDDNPRSESPADIRAQILAGARSGPGAAEVREVGDRRSAIEQALSLAAPGDTVLIAGKGHERGQEVAGQLYPFDDKAVAVEVLRAALALPEADA